MTDNWSAKVWSRSARLLTADDISYSNIQVAKDLIADGYQPAASIVEACTCRDFQVTLLSIPADHGQGIDL